MSTSNLPSFKKSSTILNSSSSNLKLKLELSSNEIKEKVNCELTIDNLRNMLNESNNSIEILKTAFQNTTFTLQNQINQLQKLVEVYKNELDSKKVFIFEKKCGIYIKNQKFKNKYEIDSLSFNILSEVIERQADLQLKINDYIKIIHLNEEESKKRRKTFVYSSVMNYEIISGYNRNKNNQIRSESNISIYSNSIHRAVDLELKINDYIKVIYFHEEEMKKRRILFKTQTESLLINNNKTYKLEQEKLIEYQIINIPIWKKWILNNYIKKEVLYEIVSFHKKSYEDFLVSRPFSFEYNDQFKVEFKNKYQISSEISFYIQIYQQSFISPQVKHESFSSLTSFAYKIDDNIDGTSLQTLTNNESLSFEEQFKKMKVERKILLKRLEEIKKLMLTDSTPSQIFDGYDKRILSNRNIKLTFISNTKNGEIYIELLYVDSQKTYKIHIKNIEYIRLDSNNAIEAKYWRSSLNKNDEKKLKESIFILNQKGELFLNTYKEFSCINIRINMNKKMLMRMNDFR